MTDAIPPRNDDSHYARIASQLLDLRKQRLQFFNRQLFGEHGWELLLALMASPGHTNDAQRASEVLGVSPATALAQARLLITYELATLSDSTGSWSEIPITLTEQAAAQMRACLDIPQFAKPDD